MKEFAIKAFDDSAEIKRRFARDHADRIVQVAQLIGGAFQAGHKVLLFGNGGSSTDAAHIAAKFTNHHKHKRTPPPTTTPTTNTTTITHIANDYGFEELFARQVRAHGQRGDVAIAISTSGNSPNVLKGVEAAKALGLTTIAWTGGTGGKLAGMVDYAFVVPSTLTARIQESHITLGHVLCELIEDHVLANPA